MNGVFPDFDYPIPVPPFAEQQSTAVLRRGVDVFPLAHLAVSEILTPVAYPAPMTSLQLRICHSALAAWIALLWGVTPVIARPRDPQEAPLPLCQWVPDLEAWMVPPSTNAHPSTSAQDRR